MTKRKIVSKKIISKPIDVYDISIDNDENYYILDNGIITHNTFDKYSPVAASGGSGPAYMADVHLMLFKRQEKEGKRQVGVNIRTKIDKSRFMIENKSVNIVLHFKRGLYKLSNLVELAYELGVFKKEGFSFIFPDGKKVKMKDVREKPSKYLDENLLESIRNAIKDEFGFGKINPDLNIEDELKEIENDDEVFEKDIK